MKTSAYRPPSKAQIKHEEAFRTAVLKVVADLACATPETGPQTWHAVYVQTIYGRLGITPQGDWIATAFDEPKRAVKATGCNPYTGKWNFHGYHAPRKIMQGAYALRDFEVALTGILVPAAAVVANIFTASIDRLSPAR